MPMGMPQNMPMGMPQNMPMRMPQNMPLGVPLGPPFSHSQYTPPHRAIQLDMEKILPQNVSSQLTAYDVKDIHKDPKPFAKGSYGVIFKGTVKGIDKPVVIKEMEIRDVKSLEDWKKEISLMVITRSAFIVELFGYNYHSGTLSIIMEYMSKGDLYNILHTNPHKHYLSRIMRFRMARHIALGVSHLHKYGIMHRDIKSMNVLVSDDYACKLSDFGTAKIVTSTIQYLTYTMNAGTPLWMAPEVKLGGNYNLPADVYSLGLVFYELFEKKLPLWDGTRQCAQLPPNYLFAFMVVPLINVNPQLRLTANQVVDMLDTLIFTLVTNVKKFVSPEHYEVKEEFKTPEEKETAESKQLYKYLLSLPKDEIDILMSKESSLLNSYLKVLNRLESSKSPLSHSGNISIVQPPPQQPGGGNPSPQHHHGGPSQHHGGNPSPQQQHHGVPPLHHGGNPSHYPHGYPPGFSGNFSLSQAYPPGYPPGYPPNQPPPGF